MLRIILALWLALSPAFAWAGSMTLLGAGAVAAGGASPAWTATAATCVHENFASATVDFGTLNVGTGTVVIGVATDNGVTQSSASIASNAMTSIAHNGQAGELWYIASFTGSTADIQVVFSAAVNTACISVGFLTGLNSTTPTCTSSCPLLAGSFTSSNPVSFGSTLTVNAGGIGVFFAAAEASATPTVIGYSSGATTDAITQASNYAGNGISVGMGHSSVSSNPGISNSCACSQFVGAAGAAWR